jgi:multisubunit Na+/H+ antiporter MnhB subunit
MKTNNNPTTRAGRRYLFEFGIFMTVYVAVCLFWMFHGASGHTRIAIALAAMIPIVFVFAAIIRYLLRTDEFIRKTTTEAAAIAGGATALITLMYSLLEGAGFPKQHAIWTYSTFMIIWLVALPFVLRRYK